MELLDNLDAKRFSVISNSNNYLKRYSEPPPANTRCWWCKDLLLTTTGAPLGCPCVSHSSKPVGKAAALGMRRSFNMKLRGFFCCYECVAAHAIHENRDSTTLSSQLNDIRLMRRFLSKTPLDSPLIPSPSWTLLRIFGGPLSREEYRRIKTSSTSVTTEERILVERPPIILLPQEERVLLRETSRQLSALRYMNVAPRRPESGGGTIPIPSDPTEDPRKPLAWAKPSGKGGGAIPAYRVVSKRTTLVSSARLPPQRRKNNKSSSGKDSKSKDFGGLVKKF